MSLTAPDDLKRPTFSISPTAGYFIGKRFALGLEAGYSIYDASTFNPATQEETSRTISRLSLTPFARYYFGVNKFAPFVEAGYAMQNYYLNGENVGDNQNYKVGAGLNYFISPSLALEGKVSYTHPVNDDSPAYKPVTLGIGLQFFLSRNQKAAKEPDQKFLEKGSWMVGGNMSLAFSENEYQSHRINPLVGYFLTDKIATGLSASYGYSGGPSNSMEAFTAAPFMRYYFATSRFAPFAYAAAGVTASKYKYYEGEVSKDEDFTYQAGVGFNYFITKNVALESELSYFRNDDNNQATLGLNAGLKFFLSRK